jgi:hypothetical protein
MRASRDDDTPFVHEQPRGNYTVMIAAGSIAVLALLLYIGLRDSDDTLPAPATQQVVRDSAVLAPPVVDRPAPLPQAAESTAPGFNERRLAPPESTVGAGTAPISAEANGERLVIDGELLEELEEDAQTEGAAQDAAD